MRPSHNLEDAKLYRKLFQTKKGVILYGTSEIRQFVQKMSESCTERRCGMAKR